MKNERVALWDNLKFFLMVLVVVGHFVDEYTSSSTFCRIFLYIYSFHMPLFFFISGLFHKNERIAEKVIGYVSLGLIFKICISAVRMGFGQTPDFHLLKTASIPWFVFAYAAFTGLTYLLRDMNLKYIMFVFLLLGLWVGYDTSLGDLLVLARIIIFYPFYLAGVMLDREKVEKFLENKKLKFAGAAILMIAVAVCLLLPKHDVSVFKYLCTGRHCYKDFMGDSYIYGAAYRACAYVVTTIMGVSVMAIMPKKHLPVITTCGSRTIQVYFWHRLVLSVLIYTGFPEMICSKGIVGKLVWLFMAVILSFILSGGMFEFPLNYIMAGPVLRNKKKSAG